MTHDRFRMTDDRFRPQVMAAERALDELEDHAADRLGAARRAIQDLERTATAALQQRDTVPRAIDPQDIQVGQLIFVTWETGWYVGRVQVDIIDVLATEGRCTRDDQPTCMLLQDAPAEESGQGVTVQQLEDAEPGSQYIAGELIATKRTTGLWGIGILRDPLTSEELLSLAEYQGLDGYIDPQEPAPAKIGDTISGVEQLDSLPAGAIVLDDDGDPWQKRLLGRWVTPGAAVAMAANRLAQACSPLTLIQLPEAKA